MADTANRKRQKDGGKNMSAKDFFAPIFLPAFLSLNEVRFRILVSEKFAYRP
jgi:hypothetical protein